jgi:hypothetical protein
VAPVTAANNRALIELGVQQVGLQRDGTPGKARQEYERSRPFQRMRNWRVGVKARISHLKRGFGFRRASLTLLTCTVPVGAKQLMELRRSAITEETCARAAIMAGRTALGPIRDPAARAAGVPPGPSARLPPATPTG